MALTVMTWNVENLFRPAAGAPADEVTIYEKKLELLSQTILAAAADVVALQEVGGAEPLLDLQQALGVGYPSSAISAFPDGRGIRNAFLSKRAILLQQDIVDFPTGPALDIKGLDSVGNPVPLTKMGRGALRIVIAVGGTSVHLITTHLKSKLLTYPNGNGPQRFAPNDETERAQVAAIALHRRAAEASTIRMHANGLLESTSQTPVIVLGDMNDVPDAATSLLLNGPEGSEIGTGGFNRADQGDDSRLFNLAPLIAEARRFSRVHAGRKELLDQILASEELFPRDANGDRTLPTCDSLVDYADNLPSIGTNPTLRRDAIESDHAPVVATFPIS